MRALKNQHGIPTFVTGAESRLFRKLEMSGYCEVNSLTEQEQHLAQNLVRQGIIRKVTRNHSYGYKPVPQVQRLHS